MDNIKARFRQYQEAIEASNIVSKTDTNGTITFVNDEFCKMSGFTREELIGANHNIVRHPEVPKEVFARLWDTILAKKVHKGTIRNRTKDGRRRLSKHDHHTDFKFKRRDRGVSCDQIRCDGRDKPKQRA